MKKEILTISLILLIKSSSIAQSGWYPLNSGTSERLTSVVFTDSNTGYAVGFNHTALKTTNAGLNWFALSVAPVGDVFRSVFFVNVNTGYIANGNFNNTGNLYKTTNGGINWTSISVPTPYYYCVFFVNSSTGYASGLQIIIKTTDGGVTWSFQEFFELGFITSIYFTNALTGFASEFTAQKVLKTTNGGSSWEEVYTYNETGGFFSTNFTDASTGFAVGGDVISPGNPMIFRTTNSGTNWTNINFIDSNITHFYSVNFLNSSTGYITGGRIDFTGRILKTVNGGINWYVQSVPTDFISDTYFINLNTGYAVGAQGIVLKTTDGGGPIGIKQISNTMPDKFYVYQNYPNPFNPATKIKFDINKSDFITIKIYDLLGRELETLVNERLNAGTYEAQWNASNYSSGVYYCRLESGGSFAESKKMILIK